MAVWSIAKMIGMGAAIAGGGIAVTEIYKRLSGQAAREEELYQMAKAAGTTPVATQMPKPASLLPIIGLMVAAVIIAILIWRR